MRRGRPLPLGEGRPTATEDERDDEQDQEQAEKNLSDPGSGTRYATESEDGCDECDNEECECPA